MHILDKVTSGVLTMIVMAICVLTFDWRIGIVFLLGDFSLFPGLQLYAEKGKGSVRKTANNSGGRDCGHSGIVCRGFR